LADKIKELQDKIAMLEKADPDSAKLGDYRKELAKLTNGTKTSMPNDGILELDVNESEWAEVKGGSNRPPAGDYLAEMQSPNIYYSDKACQLPFTIIEKGPWLGYEDSFYAARTGGADKLFKIKQIAQACGITPEINERTGKMFLDFNKFPGKKFIACYEIENGTYTNPNNGQTYDTHVSKIKRAKAASPQSLKI
jgi:hypothetical protein